MCLGLDQPGLGFTINKEGVDLIKKPGLIHDPSKTLLMFCISYIILIYFKAIKLTSRAHDEGLPPMQTSKLGLINMNRTTLILRERERENGYTNMLRIL